MNINIITKSQLNNNKKKLKYIILIGTLLNKQLID